MALAGSMSDNSEPGEDSTSQYSEGSVSSDDAPLANRAAQQAGNAPLSSPEQLAVAAPSDGTVSAKKYRLHRPVSDQSGSGSDQGGSRKSKKRQTMFKRIRSSERCGKCHTCLNPQMKKACETVRARQLAGQDGQDGMPPARHRSKRSPSPTAPSPLPPPDPSTYLRDTLEKILSQHGRGGITDVKHMHTFQLLLESQGDLGPRQVLLTVLSLSSEDVRVQAVKGKALRTLESWVVDAAEGKNSQGPEARATLICDVIRCLTVLPVDVAALRRTGNALINSNV